MMFGRRRRLIDRFLGEPEYEKETRRESIRLIAARPLPGYEYLRSRKLK